MTTYAAHVILTHGGDIVWQDKRQCSQQIRTTTAGGRHFRLDDDAQQSRLEIRNGDGALRILFNDGSGTRTLKATGGELNVQAVSELTLRGAGITLDAAAQLQPSEAAGVAVQTSPRVTSRTRWPSKIVARFWEAAARGRSTASRTLEVAGTTGKK